MPKQALVGVSLKWADDVKAKVIAELRCAWIDMDKKLPWCYWETDDLDALLAEFDDCRVVLPQINVLR